MLRRGFSARLHKRLGCRPFSSTLVEVPGSSSTPPNDPDGEKGILGLLKRLRRAVRSYFESINWPLFWAENGEVIVAIIRFMILMPIVETIGFLRRYYIFLSSLGNRLETNAPLPFADPEQQASVLFKVVELSSHVFGEEERSWLNLVEWFDLNCFVIFIIIGLFSLLGLKASVKHVGKPESDNPWSMEFWGPLAIQSQFFQRLVFITACLTFVLVAWNAVNTNYFLFTGGSAGNYTTVFMSYFLRQDTFRTGLTLFICFFFFLSLGLLHRSLFNENNKASVLHLLDFFLITTLFYTLILVTGSTNLMLLYIFLEYMSLCIVILLFISERKDVAENYLPSLQFFFLNAVAGVFLVFAATLIYGIFGTCTWADIQSIMLTAPELTFAKHYGLLHASLFFFTMFFVFKLGAFPLQFWVVDAYSAASSALFVFLNTVYKFVLLLVFMRFIFAIFGPVIPMWYIMVLMCCGLSSCVWGACSMFQETDVRRFLAHASVGTTGLLLLAAACSNIFTSLAAGVLYFLFYSVALLLVVYVLETLELNKDVASIKVIEQLDSLERGSRGFLTVLLFLSLCTLAGVPPFFSFWLKYNLLETLFFSVPPFILLIVFFSQLVVTYAFFRFFKVVGVFALRDFLTSGCVSREAVVGFFTKQHLKQLFWSYIYLDFSSKLRVLTMAYLAFILIVLPFWFCYWNPALGQSLLFLIDAIIRSGRTG
jgi:NADH-quinone oxidoreductase subunit N